MPKPWRFGTTVCSPLFTEQTSNWKLEASKTVFPKQQQQQWSHNDVVSDNCAKRNTSENSTKKGKRLTWKKEQRKCKEEIKVLFEYKAFPTERQETGKPVNSICELYIKWKVARGMFNNVSKILWKKFSSLVLTIVVILSGKS